MPWTMKQHKPFLALVVVFVIMALSGIAFVVAHPRCETCGDRYGPLIPHPHRHQTNKLRTSGISAAELTRQRATAPIINSLPPLTDANRNLTLSIEALVGRWESQDGTRTPIRFYPDGTVELGFIRKGGAWLISKGTFAIESDRVVTETKYEDIGRGATFRFARGVLYAPSGPSPRVVWQRIGDLACP